MSTPIVLPKLQWLPTPNVSTRAGEKPRLLTLHETAGAYLGAVAWLRNPVAKASAHLVLREDGMHATQLVALNKKAWTQAFYNPVCISLELANTTAKGYSSDHQLRVAARIMGWLLWKLDLPPRWARNGVGSGVCMHRELGALGGGHTECGPNDAGWQLFLRYLAREVDRGDYRKTWARF